MNAVRNFPTPRNVKEVERFLGLAGWYHCFIPYFSERAAPLNALKKKDVPWNWSEECQHSLEDLKDALQKAQVLVPPDSSKLFKVQSDASVIGLEAVLTQESENTSLPTPPGCFKEQKNHMQCQKKNALLWSGQLRNGDSTW